MVGRMPTFARSSTKVRKAAAREITRSITHADPSRPLSFDEAQRQLKQLARPAGTAKRPVAHVQVWRAAGLFSKRSRPSPIGGARVPATSHKLRGVPRFVKGSRVSVDDKVIDLEKLAELYPARGDVLIMDLIRKGVIRKESAHPVDGPTDRGVTHK